MAKTFEEHLAIWTPSVEHVAKVARRAKQNGWDHFPTAEENLMNALDKPLLQTLSYRLNKDWASRD